MGRRGTSLSLRSGKKLVGACGTFFITEWVALLYFLPIVDENNSLGNLR